MEGILFVGGFWVCMIAIVLKKPFMAYIDKAKVAKGGTENLMEARIQQLEHAVSTLGGNFTELKETTEFAQKMMIESSKKLTESHQLLIESSNRLMAAQKTIVEVVPNQPSRAVSQPTPQHQLLTYDANLGKIVDDQTVRFERVMPASVERVWQYLTQSDFLSSWFAVGTVEGRVGGRVDLHFQQEDIPDRDENGLKIRGLISVFEPNKALAFSWIDTRNETDSKVSIELSSAGDQTLISVTHTRLPQQRLHEFMAIWHTHLDVLAARLRNVMPPGFAKRYRELLQTYAMVAASIVMVSGPSAMAACNNDTYQAIQVERSHLMARYDAIWKDADDLQHQINILRRDNSDESARALGRLDSQLQNDFRDLHDIELEIKDMNRALN
ncbi:MAG TPA: SRPBCC family protein [Oculatellaceae cyanobacterium]